MGIEYYVACHKCKVIKHLDKNCFGNVDDAGPRKLADFMNGLHMGHDCVLTCDLDDDFPSDGVFAYKGDV